VKIWIKITVRNVTSEFGAIYLPPFMMVAACGFIYQDNTKRMLVSNKDLSGKGLNNGGDMVQGKS
jgi:hypothetical protein